MKNIEILEDFELLVNYAYGILPKETISKINKMIKEDELIKEVILNLIELKQSEEIQKENLVKTINKINNNMPKITFTSNIKERNLY